MPNSTSKAKSRKHVRPIPKKYVPLVKGLAGEGHAFVDIAAYFGTTSEVIARVVFDNDLAHIPALRLPKLPVLKLADIVDVSKRLDTAIKMLDRGEATAARGMIVRAAEIVNTPSVQ
jgi:hypothetical protein